mgnify:CR=1 FL=1
MSDNKRQYAANDGTAGQLEWCEDQATSLSYGVGEEAFEITHACRHENGHEGHEHRCWLCSFVWYSEACS